MSDERDDVLHDQEPVFDTAKGMAEDAESDEPSRFEAVPGRSGRGLVVALAGIAVAAAFFAAYTYAVRSAPGVAAGDGMTADCSSSAADCGVEQAAADACGGECGAAAVAAEAPSGRAVIEGGVQSIAVDVSGGDFEPAVIELASGVPTRLVFSQGEGCLAAVQFPQFGIERDLTAGGATIDLPALPPGEYPFSCGMEMVYGALVVR